MCVYDGVTPLDRDDITRMMTSSTASGGGTSKVLMKGPTTVLPRKYREGICAWYEYVPTHIRKKYENLVLVPYKDLLDYVCAHTEKFPDVSIVAHYTHKDGFDIKMYEKHLV